MNQKVKKTNTYSANNRYAANRQARIVRHLKKHPNDEQGIKALSLNKVTPSRKKPVSKLGWINNNETGAKIRGRVIGLTKQFAVGYAQMLRFCRNSQFHKLATFGKIGDDIDIQFKHASKKSNFKEVLKDGSLKVHA